MVPCAKPCFERVVRTLFVAGLTHREPLLDEGDFLRFVSTVEPLMKAGRDVMWVLVGRTESNLPKVKKVLAKFKFTVEAFYLCYNTKQMQQYGYWKRQRGIADSKSIEQALLVYKGSVPKTMPKNRMHVDAGSGLFNQVMKHVPVLAPILQSFVKKEVREISLGSMTGVPHDEDDGEQQKLKQLGCEDTDSALHQPDKAEIISRAATNIKKRPLYRQLSGTDAPWFPHDNAIELLKELCWEAGRPRWVFHGTPAGGAGVHGCLEAGSSVVALCFDEHHRFHLQQFLSERAVEAMVRGTTQVFKDETLQARSIELKLTTPTKTRKPDEMDSEAEERSTSRRSPVPRPLTQKSENPRPPRRGKQPTVAVSTESSACDKDDESSSHTNDAIDADAAMRTPPSKRRKRK